jgi:hypothetical protein
LTACSRLAVCFFPSAVFPVASIFSIDMERPPLGVFGVGHPTVLTAACRSPPPLFGLPSSFFRSALSAPPVGVLGVGQPAICDRTLKSVGLDDRLIPGFRFCLAYQVSGVLAFSASIRVGVAHPACTPEQSLPDVGGADARSAQIGGPDSISHVFQVSAYSAEPLAPIL